MKNKLLKTASDTFHHGAGLVRATIVLLIAAIIVLTFALRSGMARADETMLELGRHLVTLVEAGLGRDSRGVLLNGQTIGFRVFTTSRDPSAVLDFYDNWCRGGTSPQTEHEQEIDELDTSAAPHLEQGDRSWRDLTYRALSDDLGVIACIKHGVANISSEELGERLKAFLQSGNLRDLGMFHYAAVTRIGGQTRVAAVWTEGDFYPGEMFPEEGDAPGFDPEGFSPPPSGRRMLSAGELGHDETLGIYLDCEESIEELASFYKRDFSRQNWRVVADQSEDGTRLLIVQRANAMRVVALSKEPGGLASVTIATAR